LLLSRAIDRGDLRSAGISRFIAKPLRSYRSPSLASASSDRLLFTLAGHTRLLSHRPGMLHQGPLGNFPVLAWLLHRRCQTRCCLRPRGVGWHSSLTHLPFCLRLLSRDRHFPKSRILGAMGQIQGIHPSPRLTRALSGYSDLHATGRLTKPYPEGLMCFAFPLNVEPEPGSNDNYPADFVNSFV
jgi:hypothetical protein